MQRFWMRIGLALALVALVVGGLPVVPLPTTAAAQDERWVTDEIIAEFAAFVEGEMAYYHVPGVAVGIVEGDEVVHTQGFGVRNVETGDPFTPQTRFRIGSTTKSMTALLVAQLVDEGALDWDTPVVEILPDFQTAQPELTALITVRDLMGMDTGLVSDQMTSLEWDAWTVDDLLAAIAVQEIGGEYSEFFSYNNEVYATAGYVAAAAAGREPTPASYTDLMQVRVFDPIGMTETSLTDDLSTLGDNFARSYEFTLVSGIETPVAAAPLPIGVLGPAGNTWSTIDDMNRYLITHLNGGVTPDGERIVSAETLAETYQPGVSMDVGLPGVEDAAYGMGWVTETYRDIPIRYHDGGWEGYRTQMMIFPEANVGLVIFTNHVFGDVLNYALGYAFAEMLYDREPVVPHQSHAFFDDIYGSLDDVLAGLPSPYLEPDTVAPLVGEYEDGWQVWQRDDGTLWMERGSWQFLLYPLPLPHLYLVGNGSAFGMMIQFSVPEDAGEPVSAALLDEEMDPALSFIKLD
ncbi:MAG: beta-lactamase family protein [Chloroflexi bacterium]|nr:beta-lactamase family protein [Chloroflexota bacterium]